MKESLQGSLLHGLFRIRRVPQHSQGRGEHHPGVRADEVMETCLLTCADTRDDRFFLRRDGANFGQLLQGKPSGSGEVYVVLFDRYSSRCLQ